MRLVKSIESEKKRNTKPTKKKDLTVKLSSQ